MSDRRTLWGEGYVARLAIRTKRGELLLHDLTYVEAVDMCLQLVAAIGPEQPTVAPSWGEMIGTGEPPFFGQEIRDKFDRRRQRRKWT